MNSTGVGISAFFILLILMAGLFIAALLAFWIWSLIDCATKETDVGNQKLVWILVIAFVGVVGAAVYYFVRRPARIAELGR